MSPAGYRPKRATVILSVASKLYPGRISAESQILRATAEGRPQNDGPVPAVGGTIRIR